jgi:hypothetical protein
MGSPDSRSFSAFVMRVIYEFEGMPAEHFRKKHREKQKAGITIQETI